MPRIPEEQPPVFSTQVPGITFPFRQEFGKVGQGLEKIGNATEEAAQTGSNVYNEIQRQEAISQADNASVQHKLWADSYTRQLKIASPDGLIHENGDQQQAAVQNSDGTPRTITQEFWDQSNMRYQADQDKMSPMAAAMYRQKMLPEIGARASILNNDAYAMRLKADDVARAQTDQGVFKEFDKAPYDQEYGPELRPDLNKFSDYAQTAQLDLQRKSGVLDPSTGEFKGGLYNQTQIDQMKVQSGNEYGKHWMEASMTKLLEEKENNSPRMSKDVSNLLEVVRGQDPRSKEFQAAGKITPSTALSAQERLIYEDRLLKMVPAAQVIDQSAYKHRLEGYIAGAERGDYPAGVANASRNDLLNWQDTLQKKKQMTLANRLEDLAKMSAAEGKGMLSGRTFALQSETTQHALTERVAETVLKSNLQEAQMRGFGFTADEGKKFSDEVRARGIENVNRITAAKQKDFAAFLSSSDEKGTALNGVAKHVDNLDWTNPLKLEQSGLIPSYQRALRDNYRVSFGGNHEYWRPLTKNQSGSLGASLEAMSPTQAAQGIQSMKRSFGKSYGDVIQTMIADKSLSPEWRMYGTVPTTQGLVAQIDANKGLSATKELYEARTGDKFQALQAEVGKGMKDQIDGLLGAAPHDTDMANYTQMLLNTGANAAAKMRLNSPGMSVADSVENSKEEAFKNFPAYARVGNHQQLFGWTTPFSKGPQISTEFPKAWSEQQRVIVKQNLAHAITPEGMKEQGVIPPVPAKGQPDLGEHFYEMAARNMQHISHVEDNQHGSGYVFWHTGTNEAGTSNGVSNQLMRKDIYGTLSPVFIPDKDILVPRNVTKAPANPNIPTYRAHDNTGPHN